MTQDVQPLTWSKRTNIEEHQQFFSKINEIIGNLAPTVDEAEQAIAQATAAIASANDAVATANAASAAASAAASQAQTAASAVAGYDGRLTAAEGDIDTNTADITALQGRMGTAEGNITALQGMQPDYVKKVGAAQTVTSQIMVPTTATGLRDTQIANGTRVQNDLDAYEPMIRTTGNQTKDGIFTVPRLIAGNIGCSLPFNLANAVRAVAKISSYGIEKYNDIHLLICERSTAFYGHIYSGGSATVSAIDLINITSLSAVTPGSVDFKLGCVTREDGQHLVIEHLGGANRIFNVIILCASRGGSTALILEPDNEIIDTSVDTIVYYTNQGE